MDALDFPVTVTPTGGQVTFTGGQGMKMALEGGLWRDWICHLQFSVGLLHPWKVLFLSWGDLHHRPTVPNCLPTVPNTWQQATQVPKLDRDSVSQHRNICAMVHSNFHTFISAYEARNICWGHGNYARMLGGPVPPLSWLWDLSVQNWGHLVVIFL